MLPQLPRLLHAALARRAAASDDEPPRWVRELVREHRRTQRWLRWFVFTVGALVALELLIALVSR
jgi:hypothetical protein